MKYYTTKILGLILGASALLSSCTEETGLVYSEVEQEVFDLWIAKHINNNGVVAHYQEDGGYYIKLVSQGDTSGEMIANEACWVRYDFTGYDLAGNVCVTRNDLIAWQQGTFSNKTRYVPYYRLSGEDSYSILEGTELAFTSELAIGDEKVYLYDGAEFTIYMPSSLVGESGLSEEGGYEGQYSLSSGRPLIANIKVLQVESNPLEYEGEIIDAFAKANGGVTISAESLEDDDEDDDTKSSSDDSTAWANTVDTIAHFYLNPTFVPDAAGASFVYDNPYTTSVPDSPYYGGGVAEVDKLINAALIERFGEGITDGDVVGDESDMEVWYIGRFLDGFIFDTNIDEVKEIIYGEVATEGTAISFNAAENEGTYIDSWYYTLPLLRYGQWASIITISTYAYGAYGSLGSTDVSTSTDSSSYYDYYNYYNYYNSYYGSGYYDSYYSGYYNNYYNSYYNNYYNNYSNYSYTTTTTVNTEIPSYTPLIFEIYVVNPDDEDDDE